MALSFANFRQTYPAVGWVRGDVGTSAEALGEINDLRKELAEAREQTERVRRGPPEEALGLAQGDDAVDFQFISRVEVRRASEEVWDSIRYAEYLDVDVTWNELFSCLGPGMLNEADEVSLRKRIHAWLYQEFRLKAIRNVRRDVASEGDEVANVKDVEITISDEDFGTLIVQLRALGLIHKSERTRSVKDTKTYWALTPYGDDHLTTLRAIKREQTEAAPGKVETKEPKKATPKKPKQESEARRQKNRKGRKRQRVDLLRARLSAVAWLPPPAGVVSLSRSKPSADELVPA